MDARRTENEGSDKKIIRGPLKIYDTAPALIGGLFAEKQGKIVEYSRRVFELFFKRELAVDEVEAMTKFMDEFGLSGKDYRAYFDGDGQRDYTNAQQEASADQVFGVPICIFRGEQFWGNGRIPSIIDQAPPGAGEPISVFESGAILHYLAEKAGRFYPADIRARYNVEQWLMWQMGGLGPMLGQNGHFLLYAPEKISYAIDRYGREAKRLYSVLDTQLGRTGAFIAGEYSIADIACFPWIMTHKPQGMSLEEYPHLKRRFAAIRA